jgi:hypothetical protein
MSVARWRSVRVVAQRTKLSMSSRRAAETGAAADVSGATKWSSAAAACTTSALLRQRSRRKRARLAR